LAVEQDVRSKNHAAKYTPLAVGRRWCPIFGCSLRILCGNFSASSVVRIFLRWMEARRKFDLFPQRL